VGGAKLRRGYAKHSVKGASECLVRLVTGIERDIGYGQFLKLQTVCGAFQTQAANVLLYGFADQAAKYAMKMVRREAGNPRQIVECQRLVEMPLDMDQRPQDTLVVSGGGRVFHTVRCRFPANQQTPVRNAGYSR
jgi:hypothetical protein